MGAEGFGLEESQLRSNMESAGRAAAVPARLGGTGRLARPARLASMARVVLLSVALVFAAVTLLSGCAPKATGQQPPVAVDPVPTTSYVDLVLYFSDDQAMEILPERRRVEVPGDPAQRESTPALVVKELLKGPQDPLLRKTLPPEAKLLSLEVANGIAYVNFSKEVQTKHWGGSTGESMSILSLVHSLTLMEPLTSSSAIQKVKILVEGKTVETLAGHADISQPIGPFVRVDPYFTSQERAAELQNRVDAGQEEWRKDPLEVAKFEAPSRGLHPDLDYRLAPEKIDGKAVVTVHVGDKSYAILLDQPAKKGEGGVWVISEIKPGID